MSQPTVEERLTYCIRATAVITAMEMIAEKDSLFIVLPPVQVLACAMWLVNDFEKQNPIPSSLSV